MENFSLIDLTHALSEDTPVFPGKTKLSRTTCANYENGYRTEDMCLSTGIGTHMDAPKHFYSTLLSIDELELSKFIAPGCVINVSEKVDKNPDYAITATDIEYWENKNGQIPARSIILIYTGWSQHWQNKKYLNLDQKGQSHAPGLDASAAALLVKRNVNGIGIDTMCIDPSCVIQFKAHEILLKENLFLIENLAALDQLPPVGALIIALPMKIKNAPEAPVRVIALIQK